MNHFKLAFERYLENSDSAALLAAIQAHSIPLPADCDYPYAHRICDVQIGSDAYRVVRLADQSETVYIYLCDTPSPEEGVPYWLQGEKLQRWFRLATQAEKDDDEDSDHYYPEVKTDWSLFR